MLSVGNLRTFLVLGGDVAGLKPFLSKFFSIALLCSAFCDACSDITSGILDNLIPVFNEIKSFKASSIFELKSNLPPLSAEFKSSLTEPSNLDLRDLKKFI